MRTYPRQASAVLALCMTLLAGCASHPQKAQPPQPATSAAPQPTPSAPLMPSAGTAPSEQLRPAPGGMVGVAACDQYLSTYKACHRAAGIFAPGQLDARYELMRDSLLRDARDPVKRAALDQRCRALSAQLQEALHGKSCNAAPVSSSSSG
ncbi:MAG TPA: hypothetical protein VFW75_11695 [Acetobacteraceae bacterium]|nr:hypothetical protein [Acetobacteraceae bacterium]